MVSGHGWTEFEYFPLRSFAPTIADCSDQLLQRILLRRIYHVHLQHENNCRHPSRQEGVLQVLLWSRPALWHGFPPWYPDNFQGRCTDQWPPDNCRVLHILRHYASAHQFYSLRRTTPSSLDDQSLRRWRIAGNEGQKQHSYRCPSHFSTVSPLNHPL
ncbi:hypothetical protein D3C78_1002150 [compost metagenome]